MVLGSSSSAPPPAPAPPAEAVIQENGEVPNGEVKVEPPVVDPAAPKKCDVIVISGRKERCEAAVEALKVRAHPLSSDWLRLRGARDNQRSSPSWRSLPSEARVAMGRWKGFVVVVTLVTNTIHKICNRLKNEGCKKFAR